MVYVWFVLVCLIWGGSFILMKKAAVVFGPLSIGTGRVLGGALVLGLVLAAVAWRRRAREQAPRGARAAWSWSTAGALAVVVGFGFLYPFSMQPYLIGKLGQSGFIGMMVALVPLLTIAASAVLLRTWPSVRQWAGVLAGLACMPVLFGVGRELGVAAGDVALAATVPLGYAVSNTWIKRRLSDWSPTVLTATACGAAGMFLLPAAWAREGAAAAESVTQHPASAVWVAVGSVLVLGMLGTGVATMLFYRMIQQRGPLFAGMVTYVVPVEALLLGLADGEAVTRWQGVALGVILLSVALVQWPGKAARAAAEGPGGAALSAAPAPVADEAVKPG
ncbi:MAG: DMT family transporter [Planctomycetota bacterium]